MGCRGMASLEALPTLRQPVSQKGHRVLPGMGPPGLLPLPRLSPAGHRALRFHVLGQPSLPPLRTCTWASSQPALGSLCPRLHHESPRLRKYPQPAFKMPHHCLRNKTRTVLKPAGPNITLLPRAWTRGAPQPPPVWSQNAHVPL